MKEKKSINKESIQKFLLFLYLVSISAYKLGTGMDDIIIKILPISFLVLITLFNIRKIVISKILKWYIIFWLFYILSLLWTESVKYTMQLLPYIIYILPAIYCMPFIIKGKNDIEDCMKLVIYSFLYTILLILIRSGIGSIGSIRYGFEVGLHPNSFGSRMVIGSMFSLYFANSEKYKRKKVFYFFLTFLFGFMTVFSGSRKAIITLLLGFTLYEIFLAKGFKVLINTFKSFLIVGLIIFITFNNPLAYNILGSRFENLYNMVFEDEMDTGIVKRNFYAENAIMLFKEKPIIGVGGNGFKAYMDFIDYKHIVYSHNNYLELLSTLGIIGFLLYYYIWIYVIMGLIKSFKKKNDNLNLNFLIIIGIILITDLGNVSYYTEINMVVLSLAVLYLHFNKSSNVKAINDMGV